MVGIHTRQAGAPVLCLAQSDRVKVWAEHGGVSVERNSLAQCTGPQVEWGRQPHAKSCGWNPRDCPKAWYQIVAAMKRCSTSLTIREKQLKTIMWYHLTPVRIRYCSVVNSSLTLCFPRVVSGSGFPVLSLAPRVCSNSHPLSQWWHPTVSPSVAPIPCPQSSLASGSFPVNQLITSEWSSLKSL